ncbi:MAG: ABC transporter transmembrane domain-containing protein [Nitrospira sp.]|nr:ABC transporter transmembrane domain-containing protein [Nitrospira sp.]
MEVRLEALPSGLTWFIPAVLKYRRLLGEVVLASFFLQVCALLTPLFTQVIIDKVFVHKGFTTPAVMAVGMLVLALFDALLGGLRTYVFAHTTNRIDVGLGAQLFRHLLALPLAYFEARRVGDTVARIRELEQIRQFLTSHSVTVFLDVVFTVVFLGVMWVYSPTLTLVVMASLPLYALLSVLITLHSCAASMTNSIVVRRTSHFGGSCQRYSNRVKALAVEPPLQRRWDEQLAGYVQASFRATSLVAVAGQVASCIQKSTTIVIMWVGGILKPSTVR